MKIFLMGLVVILVLCISFVIYESSKPIGFFDVNLNGKFTEYLKNNLPPGTPKSEVDKIFVNQIGAASLGAVQDGSSKYAYRHPLRLVNILTMTNPPRHIVIFDKNNELVDINNLQARGLWKD